MPEDVKPTPAPDSPDEMSRRQFFVKLGVGSVAVAALGTAAFGPSKLWMVINPVGSDGRRW